MLKNHGIFERDDRKMYYFPLDNLDLCKTETVALCSYGLSIVFCIRCEMV